MGEKKEPDASPQLVKHEELRTTVSTNRQRWRLRPNVRLLFYLRDDLGIS